MKMTHMTITQNLAVGSIARAALDNVGGYRDAELKDWHVDVVGDAVIVRVEAGYVNDEGSALSFTCRARGVFVVGARGGVKVISGGSKHASKNDLRRHPLIYGFEK